ncbi:class II fructose-bisphosphate aldolase [Patescibacteria group bacterium]|nr:class II fructose-bisphosphate aldolase [Patescibacteria group bacterium]
MQSLKNLIKKAEKNKVAIGHFNISDAMTLRAIFEVAFELSKSQKVKIPIIIGTSEGEARFLKMNLAEAMVRRLREDYNFPIFINSDHTHSLKEVEEAVSVGYDAIIFDASKLSFEENIKQTKKAVEYIKSKNKNILVEGELGYIGGSSRVLSSLPIDVSVGSKDLTKPEEAKQFVKETKIDLLSPAVGNIHGMIIKAETILNPRLDINRIKKIREAVGIPLVLHGGSGISNADFKKAISAGISTIHINTEIRRAWRSSLEKEFALNKNETTPYKLLSGTFAEIKKIVYDRLKLFNNLK